jgi:hypothetical protein
MQEEISEQTRTKNADVCGKHILAEMKLFLTASTCQELTFQTSCHISVP